MSPKQDEYSFREDDLDGLALVISVRLNPVHTAIVHILTRKEHPLVSLDINNLRSEKLRLHVSVRVDEYSRESIDTVILAPNELKTVGFFPPFVPEKVAKIKTLRREQIRVHVKDLKNGKTLIEKTMPLDLLAVNSAPLAAIDPKTGVLVDQTRYLGAFVTPDDPQIERFLSEAGDFLDDDAQFAGYNSGVVEQVRAFYETLAARDTRYVDATLDFRPDVQSQSSQRVRLPREVLIARHANCIDNSLLMASLLEFIGIEPAIVIIPQHAMLAWNTAPGGKEWRYLETTVIGDKDFNDAVAIGTKRATAYEKQKNETGDKRYFRRWSLKDLRNAEIYQLPVTGNDELLPVTEAILSINRESIRKKHPLQTFLRQFARLRELLALARTRIDGRALVPGIIGVVLLTTLVLTMTLSQWYVTEFRGSSTAKGEPIMCSSLPCGHQLLLKLRKSRPDTLNIGFSTEYGKLEPGNMHEFCSMDSNGHEVECRCTTCPDTLYVWFRLTEDTAPDSQASITVAAEVYSSQSGISKFLHRDRDIVEIVLDER